MSRNKILAAVAQNQPAYMALPDVSQFECLSTDSFEKFAEVVTVIGGEIVYAANFGEIEAIIALKYTTSAKIITPIRELRSIFSEDKLMVDSPHDWYNVDLAIIKGEFGVAENGAVWITEEAMGQRALPFITQHLAVIIYADAIVPTMHKAYGKIGEATYGFGTFIAGPSKTADIEQALVIGAHGPKSMTVFVMAGQPDGK